jgi:hypothetical protein
MEGFGTRLLVLGLVLAATALWDRWRYGAEARRAGEYAFLLAVGLIGALVGGLLDQISVRVSPDYFVYGKGLEAGQGLIGRASLLGAQAGFVAGVVAGGVLLLVNQPQPQRPALSGWGALRIALPWVVGVALAGEALGAFALAPLDLMDLERELRGLLEPPRIEAFQVVWGMHAGLYAGAALGLVVAAWRVRGARLRSGLPAAEVGSSEGHSPP